MGVRDAWNEDDVIGLYDRGGGHLQGVFNRRAFGWGQGECLAIDKLIVDIYQRSDGVFADCTWSATAGTCYCGPAGLGYDCRLSFIFINPNHWEYPIDFGPWSTDCQAPRVDIKTPTIQILGDGMAALQIAFPKQVIRAASCFP